VSGGQGTLFDERFLGRHAGAIMSDPTTALVELVANAWDAYATKVEIQWPDRETGAAFRIEDNGLGMSADEFEIRWRTLDYNRLSYQGATVMPRESRNRVRPRFPATLGLALASAVPPPRAPTPLLGCVPAARPSGRCSDTPRLLSQRLLFLENRGQTPFS